MSDLLLKFIRNFEKKAVKIKNFEPFSKNKIKLISENVIINFMGESNNKGEFYYSSNNNVYIVSIIENNKNSLNNFEIEEELRDSSISFFNNYFFTIFINTFISKFTNNIIAKGVYGNEIQEFQILIFKKNELLFFDDDQIKCIKLFKNCIKLLKDVKSKYYLSFNNFIYGTEIIVNEERQPKIKNVSKSTLIFNLENSEVLVMNEGIQDNHKFEKLEEKFVYKKTDKYISFKLSSYKDSLTDYLESTVVLNYDFYSFLLSCFSSEHFYQIFLKHNEIKDIYKEWFDKNDFEILIKFLSEESFRNSLSEISNINIFLQSHNIKIIN